MSNYSDRHTDSQYLVKAICLVGLAGGVFLLSYPFMAETASPVSIAAMGAILVFLSALFFVLTPLLFQIENNLHDQHGALKEADQWMGKYLVLLEIISENTKISDAAKSLTHRREEFNALREAIQDDISEEHWDQAFSLVKEYESRFGMHEEAKRLMQEISFARDNTLETRLVEAIEVVERHFEERAWDRANSEMKRLRTILPNDDRVNSLHERMEELKVQHKQDLRREWDDAVAKNDTDHAIEVLKELDHFLTTEEVQELEESARSVFQEKRVQLSIQFRFAVKEKRWKDALNIALEILRDFPNTRMAEEVRSSLDKIREKARQAEKQMNQV